MHSQFDDYNMGKKYKSHVDIWETLLYSQSKHYYYFKWFKQIYKSRAGWKWTETYHISRYFNVNDHKMSTIVGEYFTHAQMPRKLLAVRTAGRHFYTNNLIWKTLDKMLRCRNAARRLTLYIIHVLYSPCHNKKCFFYEITNFN